MTLSLLYTMTYKRLSMFFSTDCTTHFPIPKQNCEVWEYYDYQAPSFECKGFLSDFWVGDTCESFDQMDVDPE